MSRRTPIFGYGSDHVPRSDLTSLKRGLADHESWVEAVLPADAEAGRIEEVTNRRPLLSLAVVGLVLVSILGLRLASLQLVNGRRNFALAEGNRIRQKVVRAPRGVIYDRDKQILARNVASFDLTVTAQLLPRDPGERQAQYQRASQLVGVPIEDLKKAGESKQPVTQPQLVATGIDRDKALKFDQSGNFPGISLDVNPVREYLDGGLLPHLLGYTGRVNSAELKARQDYRPTDYIGKLGIEKQYEATLKGDGGSEQTEVDAGGRVIKVLAARPARAGSNLVLSIDQKLERKLAETIGAQMSKAGSPKGAGVALNPKTGEILAAVSLPSYDNNLFSRGIKTADYQRLTADKAQPLFNKAISGAYPTGSIIKPLVASAALQEKVVTPQTTIVDEGKLELVNPYNPDIKYVFKGWEHSGLGVMNVFRAVAMSSDIYFYTVGGGFKQFVGLGIERLSAYYQRFGLGAKSGVDLPDETAGRVPTPEWKKRVKKEPWTTGDTYNVSVGQGDILASPLQMAAATAAVANGGILFKPQFLKQITSEQGQVTKTIEPVVIRRDFISPANLAVVREAMRQTITSGTACCQIEQQVPVAVAGKTGTAETDPDRRKPHAWFTAFAPYRDPQIVIVVLIENSGEGSEFAAPAVRETLSWYFRPH